MKLYTSGRAPNPRRVRVFCAEKGLTIPMVEVDIGELKHKEASYRDINPLAQLPALELDDGRILTESVAICRYIEALYPEPNMMGRGGVEQAFVEMWNRRMEHRLMMQITQVFRHGHPGMAKLESPQIADWSSANRPRAEETLRWLDSELADKPYVAGDRFTIADITAAIALDMTKPAKIIIPEELSHLHRWRAGITARPGYVR